MPYLILGGVLIFLIAIFSVGYTADFKRNKKTFFLSVIGGFALLAGVSILRTGISITTIVIFLVVLLIGGFIMDTKAIREKEKEGKDNE